MNCRSSRRNKPKCSGVEIDFRGYHRDLPNWCSVFHFLSVINPSIFVLCSLLDFVCFSKAWMYYFSRNIISASFWWRLHKSESFISRRHTSSKTPGRILLFLSNHFLSIFWCQDPSWLTSAGSIWVPYRPVFPVFCHDTWLISAVFGVHVETKDFSTDMQHLAEGAVQPCPWWQFVS